MEEQPMIKKLKTILENVNDGKYDAKLVSKMEEFSDQLARDIKSDDRDEGIAILGFLLQNGYVNIEQNSGIVIKDRSKLKELELI